jgi:hypothetical protein
MPEILEKYIKNPRSVGRQSKIARIFPRPGEKCLLWTIEPKPFIMGSGGSPKIAAETEA